MSRITDRIIEHAPPRIRPGLTLAVRTVRDSVDDRLPGLAAEVAFFVILSLPPLLLTFVGTAGYLGGEVAAEVQRTLVDAASTVFSTTTVDDLEDILATLLSDGRPDVVSVGFVFTLWSASRALNATVEAVTIAYDLDPQRRSGVKQRLASYGFTIVALGAGAVLMLALVAGPRIGANVAQPLGLSDAVLQAWRILYWPVIATLAAGFIALLYHIGAPWYTPWRRDVPGAILAVAGWLLGSSALRFYADISIRGGESAVYRTFAAPLVLLLWVYVTSFVVLLGAELNAEIEKMWPTPRHGDERDRMLAPRMRRTARRVRDRLGRMSVATVPSDDTADDTADDTDTDTDTDTDVPSRH